MKKTITKKDWDKYEPKSKINKKGTITRAEFNALPSEPKNITPEPGERWASQKLKDSQYNTQVGDRIYLIEAFELGRGWRREDGVEQRPVSYKLAE